ncbi:MAG: hypothetical protein PWP07_983 [Epulopiscium sp.]|jgi:hypothetical protein|nr:hypothetical protein [Candidatus Epulonipiscium sp.]
MTTIYSTLHKTKKQQEIHKIIHKAMPCIIRYFSYAQNYPHYPQDLCSQNKCFVESQKVIHKMRMPVKFLSKSF